MDGTVAPHKLDKQEYNIGVDEATEHNFVAPQQEGARNIPGRQYGSAAGAAPDAMLTAQALPDVTPLLPTVPPMMPNPPGFMLGGQPAAAPPAHFFPIANGPPLQAGQAVVVRGRRNLPAGIYPLAQAPGSLLSLVMVTEENVEQLADLKDMSVYLVGNQQFVEYFRQLRCPPTPGPQFHKMGVSVADCEATIDFLLRTDAPLAPGEMQDQAQRLCDDLQDQLATEFPQSRVAWKLYLPEHSTFWLQAHLPSAEQQSAESTFCAFQKALTASPAKGGQYLAVAEEVATVVHQPQEHKEIQ
eukprot:m.31208 g.31208  ORF g.31208 m.31208 type:complete len:300 (+) comp12429_c0_seq2:434-1333(+)